MPRETQRKTKEEAAAVGAPTLITFVYDNLRRDIIAGKFVPNEKLRIEHIRSTYDVAASTMREALARLVSDGLVTVEGQRGFRVAPMSLDDLKDITRLRRILETEAVLESISKGDIAWECTVVAAFHNLVRAEEQVRSGHVDDILHWEETNKEFHKALTSACTSARLLSLVQMLYRQHERYRLQSLIHRSTDFRETNSLHPRNVHQEHEALMRAAIGRNTGAARQILEEHIQNTADSIEKRLSMQAAVL